MESNNLCLRIETAIVLGMLRIGISMSFVRITAAVRPSSMTRPRIGWKVYVPLYALLISITAVFVATYVMGAFHQISP
jgi:hypothetical protein